MTVTNEIVGWVSNFRVRMLLQGALMLPNAQMLIDLLIDNMSARRTDSVWPSLVVVYEFISLHRRMQWERIFNPFRVQGDRAGATTNEETGLNFAVVAERPTKAILLRWRGWRPRFQTFLNFYSNFGWALTLPWHQLHELANCLVGKIGDNHLSLRQTLVIEWVLDFLLGLSSMQSVSVMTLITGSLVTGLPEADLSDLRRDEERVMQEFLNSPPLTFGKKFITASRRTSLLGERGKRFERFCV